MLVESIAFLGAGWLGGYLFARSGFPWPGGMVRSTPEEAPAPTPAAVPTVEEEIARALRQGLPLALFTLAWGLNMQLEKHRKIARWTMPLWLYVSITGVLVYLMISPYY